MPESYAPALALVVRLVQEGGALLRAEFHRPGGPRGERGHAPIDDVVEEHLRRRLRAAFPDWGYRGEETRPHEPPRDPERHVWLVDPNDGTAAFIRGQRGSAVSVGLLRGGQPVLGVVYAPCAPDDDGDLFAWAEGCGPLRRNDVPVETLTAAATVDAYTVALLSDGAERRPRDNLRALQPARYRGLPSIAYRLALAAAGEGAVAVSLHTPGDWDYGGGHALLLGAGGVFVDERGRPIRYRADGESHTQRCFGGPAELADALVRRPWQIVLNGQPPAWPDPALPFDFLRLTRGEHVPEPGLLARAQGCLLGMVAGDALGALLDGENPASVRERCPDGPGELADGGPHQIIAGQPVASERTLLLARGLVEARGYDRDTLRRAEAWYDSLPHALRPASPATRRRQHDRRARRQTVDGEAVAAPGGLAPVARSPQAFLTRAAPLGVYGCCLPAESLAAHARAEATRSGYGKLEADACAALAIAIGHAVRSGEPPGAAHQAALAWSERASPDVHAALLAAAPDSHLRPDPGAPVVLQTLQAAFAAALDGGSLEAGVRRATLADSQASACAAVVGGLLGAIHGRDAVPLRWRRLILSCRPTTDPPVTRRPRPRPLWPTDLLALAERLLLVGLPPDR